MTWLKDGRLACDVHSKTVFDYPGPRTAVTSAARVKGWTVFDGESFTRKPLHTHLCPVCSKIPREPKPIHLAGEVPLWEVEDERIQVPNQEDPPRG